MRANAYAISFRLLGRPGPAGAVADAVAREVARTGGVATPDWLGFLAADAVARSLEVATQAEASGVAGAVDDGPRSADRAALRKRLHRATGEQRAAAALVHLAGYPPDVVADHLDVPVDRVVTLAAVIAPPHGISYRDLGDPSLRRGAARPAASDPGTLTTDTGAVPVVQAAPRDPAARAATGEDGAAAAPAGSGPVEPLAQRGPLLAAPVSRRGRRARTRHTGRWASILGAAVVVAALVLGASLAVGERPTLGERAPGVAGAAVGADVVPLPAAGCAAGPDGAVPSTEPAAGGVEVRSVATVDGDRPYRLWTPPAGPDGDGNDPSGDGPAPRPLVIAVPGFGQDAEAFVAATGLEDALGADALVATVDPLPPEREVNAAQDTTRPDDLLYALAVYDDVASSRCVDLNRTSVVGYGPGGQLATLLACTRPEYFAAVVAVHGTAVPEPCPLDPHVSLLGVWTADDAVLPLGGGLGADLPSVAADPGPLRLPPPAAEDALRRWGELLGATATEQTSEADGTAVTALRAPGGAEVVSLVRPTGGHGWPEGLAERIGRFLAEHARATG